MKENKNTTIVSMLELKERISEIVEYLRFTYRLKTIGKIAESISFGRTNLSAALNGSEKYLTEGLVDKFCMTYPELNKNWLLTGEGDMLNEGKGYVQGSINSSNKIEEVERKQIQDEVYPVPYDDYMMVEYADITTAAGRLGGDNPATLPETKRRLVPKEYEKGKYLVITVYGDSMEDGTDISIPNGAEILVKEYTINFGQKLPIRNNLFVLVTHSGTVFKQIIEENSEEEYFLCHSYNPKYKDYKIPFEEIIQIFIFRKIVSFRPYIPEF